MKNFWIVFGFLCMQISSSVCAQANLSYFEKPQKVANITYSDLSNTRHRLYELPKQYTVIHYWATWCSYCIKEMPSFLYLKSELEKKNVNVIPISLDFDYASVKNKVNYKGIDIEKLNSFTNLENNDMELLPNKLIPSTFILNEKQEIVLQVIGSLNWYDNVQVVLDLIP